MKMNLKSKNNMERWSNEIIRCENKRAEEGASEEELAQANWKIKSIIDLYSKDPALLFEFIMLVESKVSREI